MADCFLENSYLECVVHCSCRRAFKPNQKKKKKKKKWGKTKKKNPWARTYHLDVTDGSNASHKQIYADDSWPIYRHGRHKSLFYCPFPHVQILFTRGSLKLLLSLEATRIIASEMSFRSNKPPKQTFQDSIYTPQYCFILNPRS